MDTGQSVGTGPGVRLMSEFDYMPPTSSAEYQTRPLPAAPPRRSLASSSNPQVNIVSKTSNRSFDNAQLRRDWERDEDNMTNISNSRMGAHQSQNILKIDVDDIPHTPSDEILSPQPRQSVQKILRLTGNVSPTASVGSSGSPTLHNSSQKIKQLTGLDVSSGGSGQSQLHSLQTLQEDVSPISASSSIYSQGDLERTISDSDRETPETPGFSHPFLYTHNVNNINTLDTPLSAPNFGASSMRPISGAPISPTSHPAALRLSAFHGPRGSEASSRIESWGPSWGPRDNEYQYRQSSGGGSWTSSMRSSMASHVVDLYHNTASDIARHSAPPQGSRSGAASYTPPPAVRQHSAMRESRPDDMLQKSRLNLSSSSSSLPPTPMGVGGRTESLSDRRTPSRHRDPPALEQSRKAPIPGAHSPPQHAPYPLRSSGLKSAFDDEDGQKRSTLLSKVFGGGSGNGSNKQDPSGSRFSWAPSSRLDRNPAASVSPSSARKAEGPDPPWPQSAGSPSGATATTGAADPRRPVAAAPGILQRTMDTARQSVGLKTKAEKRRQGLREKIRVVGMEETGGAAVLR